ncbi:alcohol dehydrogenase [Hortaea werneckii]|nr:alcohol dehydrogenase [Hortaea werneckii]KAI7320494.1 alcohol dehydrogenase [Hortaea werneckii]
MTEVEIPKQCKAGVVVNEGPDFRIEVQMVDVPEPKDDEVLLKLNCTGLCMSDVHFMLNDWAVPPMSTFNCKCAGHEGAGEVVKVGKNVTNWKIGDRGGVKPIWDVCHNCEQCWNGRENYCPNAAYTGLVATGTYQQYITSPARYTSRIPEGVSDEVAAPIMCSASTMHRALWDSGLRAGNFVVFPGGGGGVGIQGVQLAKAMGMRPVVVDSGAAKKDLSFKMGAEAFVDFKEHEDVAAKVKEVCDGVGAHGVLVTAYQSYKDAISFIADRIGGKIMCIALPPAGAINLGSDPNLFIFKNMSIIGTLVGTMQDTAACLDYARRGLLKQIMDSDGSSVHTTPSLRGHAHDNVPGKTDVDSHFRLEREAEADRPDESSAAAESPPPFSSHNFPSRYFPAPSPADPYKALVTGCETSSALPALAPQDHPSAPAPPFEEEERPASESSVVAETKAALPPDTKEGRSSKDLDDGEPPPPYTEGSSPLDGFTYIMAAAGGAATADENITLELRGTRFTLSRDELLTLPEFVLLSLFPNGLLPDGHMNSYHDGDVYPVDVSQPRVVTQVTALPTVTAAQVTKVLNNQDVYLSDTIFQSQYDPTSLQYMLEFFRHVAQTIPQGDDAHSQSDQDLSQPSQTMPIEPMPGNARDMLQDRAGIIVLREDLDFYAIPPRRDIEQPEMIEVKRAAGKALLHQDGIFSGLRKSEEPGTTEQHLIEMLTAGGFDHADTWGHRAAEPNKAVICSIALARLRTDIRGEAANSNAVGMAQKLLLFWRKPARRCWWEGIELDNVEGVEGKLKVWIRRVWTLEMVSLPQKPNIYG